MREGRLVSEAEVVSHFVDWHNGRCCTVPAGGDFDKHLVWPCSIVQRNCKCNCAHEIEKNNGQWGPCLQRNSEANNLFYLN